MEIKCFDLKELDKIADDLLLLYPEKRIFCFYGSLGAGKTTFIQSICKKLLVVDNVVSPSFAILNEYKTEDNSPIFHFDFYRIKNISEFLELGFEDYFYSGSYCFIEWAEKIEQYLPENSVSVKICVNGSNRLFSF